MNWTQHGQWVLVPVRRGACSGAQRAEGSLGAGHIQFGLGWTGPGKRPADADVPERHLGQVSYGYNQQSCRPATREYLLEVR